MTDLRGVKIIEKGSSCNTYRRAVHSQRAYMSQHEINARTKFPATDLEKRWIIDGGALVNMTTFKKDCNNIQPTYKIIYLADGSSALCKYMENISLTINKNNKVIGSLILEDVLIVPNMDRRLFSVNAFLSKGHNWVHFSSELR